MRNPAFDHCPDCRTFHTCTAKRACQDAATAYADAATKRDQLARYQPNTDAGDLMAGGMPYRAGE